MDPDEAKNIKLTLAAPEWFHLRHGAHTFLSASLCNSSERSGEHAYRPGVYNDREEYFNDIAAAYRQELAALYAAGCRNVQIDDPLLAYFCNVSMLQGLREEGQDPDALLDSYIRLYQNCLKGRPRDLTVGLHLCRGNFRHSIHFSEGGYDLIAKKLFNEVNVDIYYLEYDTPRAGPCSHSFIFCSRVADAATMQAPLNH